MKRRRQGRKALAKWVRPVCSRRHIHAVCSPQRETQTVQHAAERRDDRRRGGRQRGETTGPEGEDRTRKYDGAESCRWIAGKGLERGTDVSVLTRTG